MVWLDLAELLHKSLAETLATVPNSELYLWIARHQRRHPKG
jgi:uncharacterized protein YktB (UPF0637 family)